MKKITILLISVMIFTSFFVIAQHNTSVNIENKIKNKTPENLTNNSQTEANDLNLTNNSQSKSDNLNKSEKVNAFTKGNKKGNLTQAQIQKIIQNKNRIMNQFGNQAECPTNCTCQGATVKCDLGDGTRQMTVSAGKSGNKIVQTKGVNMSTNVTLYKENGKVYGQFKGNQTKEIILPDQVKEKIREQKRIQIQNESMNLTEQGEYKIQAKKRARFLGIIPVKEKVQMQVSAETGEIIKQKNPWWGFLAFDKKTD